MGGYVRQYTRLSMVKKQSALNGGSAISDNPT